MTLTENIEAILRQEDGLTSGQIIERINRVRPVTKATVHPLISRMGKDNKLFRHLGRWYTWPESAKLNPGI